MNMVQWVPTLTSRELQILALAALGYSAKEIGLRCGIAYRTVQSSPRQHALEATRA